MKFLVYVVAIWAVAFAKEEKKEKRGLLGLGYGHGAIAEPLSYGYGPSLSLGADHGIALSAPLVKSIPAPISYAAPAISYSAPLISKSYAAPIAPISYSAPIISKSYAAPIAPISYSAPLFSKSYAAPIAPISYSAPLISKSYAAPISYSAPLYAKSYAAPLISAPLIKSYAAPLSLEHGLGYSDLSLGYGKLLH